MIGAQLIRSIFCLTAAAALVSSALGQVSQEKVFVEVRAASLSLREIEMIRRGEENYLPAVELFNFLGIKATFDTSGTRISGFFKNPDSAYVIDLTLATATYRKRTVSFTERDYLSADRKLYLNLNFFKTLFNVEMAYLPRRLQVQVKNALEIPTIVVGRRLRGIENRIQYKKIPKADYVIGRDFKFIAGGLINWSTIGRFSKTEYLGSRNNLNFGVKTMGGDFTGRFLAQLSPGRHTTTFRGNLRYPFFSSPLLRQIIIGDHLSLGVTTQEVTGVEITNRPAALRRLFTREVFRGNVDPNMEVTFAGGIGEAMLERTDETGAYQFDVPVLYGNGLLEVHGYDSWGQERTLRYRMNIPRSLIPPGEFEYSISAGKNRQRSNSPFTTASSFSWGLSREITVGSEFAYYDVSAGQQFFPGLTSTARLLRNLILQANFFPHAYGSGTLTWEFPSSARLAISETRYPGASSFNPSRIINNLGFSGSVPIFSRGNSSLLLDASIDRTAYADRRVDDIQASVNTVIGTFSPSWSSRYVSVHEYGNGTATQVKQSVAALGFLMPAGLNVRTDLTYNHLTSQVEAYSLIGVKRFESGFTFAFSYFRLSNPSSYTAGLRLTYYFPFARAQAGVSSFGSNRYEYVASASGNINFDLGGPQLSFSDSRGNTVGNSGFIIRPFLDENGNGKKDKEEQVVTQGRAYYSNLTVGGLVSSYPLNRANRNRIFSYEDYAIFLDPESLENPNWIPEYTAIRAIAEPNYFRRIDIPIVSGGIVRGSVFISEKAPRAAEGYTVTITTLKTAGAAEQSRRAGWTKSVTTFSTGEFEFLGVPPGRYLIALDPAQLTTLQYASQPVRREFEILVKPDGDIVNDQNFALVPKQ